MTLDEVLLRELDTWMLRQPGDILPVHDHTGSAQLMVERLDALGCELSELRVLRSSEVGTEQALKEWSRRIVERATGLLERLQLLEVDAPRGQAVLRSTEPARKGDRPVYYELTLNLDGSARLCRYRGANLSSKRVRINFILTKEALAKLVADLVS